MKELDNNKEKPISKLQFNKNKMVDRKKAKKK